MFRFFALPIFSLVFGLVAAGLWSWSQSGDWTLVLKTSVTILLLSVLEISLSLDNAVVNATVLARMSDIWKKRFLTWGMVIAVFGMRLVFPVLIVSMTASISIFDSIRMAVLDPNQYSALMLSNHFAVSCYGGSFLLMVFLHFFINAEKDFHWIPVIEKPFTKFGYFKSVELLIALVVLVTINRFLPPEKSLEFIMSFLWGVITFLAVHGISELLEGPALQKIKFLSSGLGTFLYLEVLDASFSFDGVVGAFAISHELIVIIVGLSVGAFFVRGITLYLVANNTLDQFKYIEHGAFYALGTLAFIMLLDPFFHFSEWSTALTGGLILGLSIFWSIYVDRQNRAK